MYSFAVGLMERELEDHVLAPLRGLMAAIATFDERIERRDKLRVEYERCLEKVWVLAQTLQLIVQNPNMNMCLSVLKIILPYKQLATLHEMREAVLSSKSPLDGKLNEKYGCFAVCKCLHRCS